MASKSAMVDLGKKYGDAVVKSDIGEKEMVNYPTLHIADVPELDDLPDGEFKFTATGRVISHSERYDKDGTRHCSCEIEVTGMQPDESAMVEEDSLDSAISKIEKKKAKVVTTEEDDEGE